MRDYSTHTATDAGRFDRMHNGFEDSALDYEREDESDTLDTSEMHRCPFGCYEFFKTTGRRYKRHVALHTPENDPWLV